MARPSADASGSGAGFRHPGGYCARSSEEFLRRIRPEHVYVLQQSGQWLEARQSWKRPLPSMTPDYFVDRDHVNTATFLHGHAEPIHWLAPEDLVVTGNGTEVGQLLSGVPGSKSDQRAGSTSAGARWVGICRSRSAPASRADAAVPSAPPAMAASSGTFRNCTDHRVHYQSAASRFSWSITADTPASVERRAQLLRMAGFVGADPASGVATASFEQARRCLRLSLTPASGRMMAVADRYSPAVLKSTAPRSAN